MQDLLSLLHHPMTTGPVLLRSSRANRREGKKAMKHLSFTMFALFLSAGAASAQDVPQAAVDACLKHADAYNGVGPGTAKFNGAAEADVAWFGPGAGNNLRLQVDVEGGVDLSCTVSPDGKRVALEPAGG
jgi:hypothetical protein